LNTGFGTGLDERGDSFDQSVILYSRDIEQAPDPIDYTIHMISTHLITPEVGLVRAELDLKTRIFDQELSFNHMRLTVVFTNQDQDGWKIFHHHTSLPSSEHGAKESFPIKELEDRNKILQRLVEKRTKELKEANLALKKLAVTDQLTGLSNRAKADSLLVQEISRVQRYDSPLSIILFDVDKFKEINDTRGHNFGDKVLIQVGELLRSILRTTDLSARWGGDEFLILCPQAELGEAVELAERIRLKVATINLAPDVTIATSLGVTQAIPGDSTESLVERADRALYDAKHNGKNRVASR
jgi:diguanylate cyclase (GGDEF)-like protein